MSITVHKSPCSDALLITTISRIEWLKLHHLLDISIFQPFYTHWLCGSLGSPTGLPNFSLIQERMRFTSSPSVGQSSSLVWRWVMVSFETVENDMKWCAVCFFAYLHSVTSNMTRCILQSQQLVGFVSRENGGRKILAWKWWKLMEINTWFASDLLKFGGLCFWIRGTFRIIGYQCPTDYSHISSRDPFHGSFLGYFTNPDRRLPKSDSW